MRERKNEKIVILGTGFAGLWSALGAARLRYELAKQDDLEIVVFSSTDYHDIRVRNYEDDLSQARLKSSQFLNPVNVKFIQGYISTINTDDKLINYLSSETGARLVHAYDKLILATGSKLYLPDIKGLDRFVFSIDTFDDSVTLSQHLSDLPKMENNLGKHTVIVVGSGFTGLELVTELPSRLREVFPASLHKKLNVILMDRNSIASSLGAGPNASIISALEELGITLMPNSEIQELTARGVLLDSGETIPSKTVICTAGMRASQLTDSFGVEKDHLGRLYVDSALQVMGIKDCYAAGDVACAKVDELHVSTMSCQHARPQGKIAGYNAVAELYGFSMMKYQQPNYVTCLDLGEWGALYMTGWSREIKYTGDKAKSLKRYINHEYIYPPLSASADELFEAADPNNSRSPLACFLELHGF